MYKRAPNNCAVLVLFGSHQGIESHVDRNRENLIKLIELKHGITLKPEEVITEHSIAEAQVGFDKLLKDRAGEKYVYYVGHGGKQGELKFRGSDLFLPSILPPQRLPQQKIYLHLFMCYQHEAFASMRQHLQQPGFRDMYLTLDLADVAKLTQNYRDKMNEKICNYQLQKNSSQVLDEYTVGTADLGHKDLHNEVQREAQMHLQQKIKPR